MKYFKRLVSKNVYLSPISIEDAEQYTKWLNDLSTIEGLGMSSTLLSLQSEKEWVEKSSSEGYQFAIIKASDDTLMGNCGINQLNQIHRNCEIGIFIGDEENRSHGYGSEALTLLLNFCFNSLDMENVMLKAFAFNERAIAAYKKIGFKEVGRRRKATFVNGKRHDDVIMDILKDEFNEIHNK